jgi:vancomycin aglycone glucosyltransferase
VIEQSLARARGDVKPMVGRPVQLRALCAEVPVCAPPDLAELLARIRVPLVPVGQPVRPLVTGATPPAAILRRRAGESVAAQFDTVAAVADECDALVATGAMPTGVSR